MAPKNVKDHWAFLEEIEAPMWVDLADEAACSDSDDQWFHISHPFHQQSSKQLKAAFAHSGDEEFGLVGQYSSQLPSSVSRSRGKHLASKKSWKGGLELGTNKPHPVKGLKGKSSLVNSGLDDVRKPKVSIASSRGTSKSQVDSASERALTGSIEENGTFPLGNGQHSQDCSSSGDAAGEASTSTLTSETYQLPQRANHELSKQPFGRTSGILAELRISIQKSCITRQAARVEIKNDTIQTTYNRSSSSKSGVESSVNPGFDLKSEANHRPSSGKSSWGSSSNSANDVLGNKVRKSSSAKSGVQSSGNPGFDLKSEANRRPSAGKSSWGSSSNSANDVIGNRVRKSSSAKSSVGSSSNPSAYTESKPSRRSSSGKSSSGTSSKPCAYVKSKPSHRSSSSKPSISSSSNPGGGIKCSGSALVRGKEWTSDSRNVASNIMAGTKIQGSNVLRDSSNIQLKDGPRNTRLVNKANVAKSSAHLQLTKRKALIQTVPAETRQLHRVNEKGSLIGAAATPQKLGSAGADRLVGAGKENAKARTCGNQKVNVVAGGGLTNGQTKKTLVTRSKGDISSLDNPKGNPCNYPIKEKQRPVATTQRLHFR